MTLYDELLKQREENRCLKRDLKRVKYLQMLLDRKETRARLKQAYYDDVTSDEHLTFDALERTLIQEGFGQ